MPPHLAPACRRRPTFHDHRTNLDAIAEPRDAVAELEMVRQTIRQRAEAADLGELLARRRQSRAEGEVKFPKASPWQTHAPEIRVYRHGFPAHVFARRELSETGLR